MDNPKKLLRSDLRRECGDSYYERGRLYFEKGHVTNMTIMSEGALFVQLNASVKGTDQIPYKQNVRIAWRPDFSSASIDGDCTCPIGYNCKHIAAVCLMYQNKDHLPAKPQSQDITCLDWLASLSIKPTLPASHEEFIAYILKPGKLKNEYSIELQITKNKKNGGFNKGKKSNLSSIRYGANYLSYINAEDQEIVQLLSALNSGFMGDPIIVGSAGFLALAKLTATHRLFWQSLDYPALQEGPARELNISWQQTNGDYELTLGFEPKAQIIITDPPYFLDINSLTVGPINTPNLSHSQLKKMLAAPIIPKTQVDAFSERLIVEYPNLPLPPPKPISLTQFEDVLPKPRLLLFGQPSNPQQYIHLIAVAFDYGEYTLSAYQSKAYSILKTERGLLQINRNTRVEAEVIERLLKLGFITIEDPDLQELVLFSPNGKSAIESTTRWANFMHQTLPQVEEEGWLVTVADSFNLNFHSLEHWDAEISDSKTDWFDMRFNVTIDDKSIPLLPLIMPVLEHYDLDNLPEVLSIPINSHNCLSVPASKIRPFLAILYELFNSSTFESNGNIKISRFNAASIAKLESQNQGLFTLSGGEELRAIGQKLKNFSGILTVEPPKRLLAELRPYQQQGLNWLQFLREYRLGGILADDMGLGKTLQTLAHLQLEKQQGRLKLPCLIIAPTSLMANWRREANRFTPDLSVLILQGNERKERYDQIQHHDVILTTYPLLPRDELELLEQRYYYLILDEAQVIKNPNAKAAKVVRRINAKHRLCLTGTPMENHLGELWAHFDFLMPGFLGDSNNFKKNYRTPIEQHGDDNKRHILSHRIAPFMLRRSKQEVAAELPAKTEIICSVPLHEQQAALYESVRLTMEKKVRDAIAQKGLARSHITILEALLKLRQTCCDPRILPLNEAQKVKQSAKLDLLMDLLPDQLEEGRRILVFSQFTRMISLIEQELNNRHIIYTKLTGQTKNREAAIELFKNGTANVFLISLKAGGVGLNLTEADTVIIYDPWWNPATEQQAADRAHRIGQDKPVFIYKLLTESTVEEKILALQSKKSALANSIYQDSAQEPFSKLSAEDLSSLFEPL
ncbi:MAG: DEAD/DEAH box helicase [Methylococcaceae bacterium]|jgi:superfamily II DNA or RNA helicase